MVLVIIIIFANALFLRDRLGKVTSEMAASGMAGSEMAAPKMAAFGIASSDFC